MEMIDPAFPPPFLAPPWHLVKMPLPIVLALATTSAVWGEIDFAREIQPILSENCYFCHGPDGAERKADLRLDTEEGARASLQSHDGKPSELLYRITTDDADDLMPPPDSNRALTETQRQLIAQWLAEGAPWGQHWAFEPIRKPAVPQPGDGASSHPVDAFLARRLAAEGLDFSPPAEPGRLLRRVSLDLTGLPPSPAEVTDFLRAWERDPDQAYGTAIDRLLDSPAYGERMAWDWLEAARYADTNGYQGDAERTMYPWRDWVVKAFNQNVPYDDFSIWQLAGDLLPGATFEQRMATGFLRSHPINGEGGRIAEENRVEYVFDMAETTGTLWLGLTFNCCRCHDHKYDPLTQVDYYSMTGFFNQTPVDGKGGSPQTQPTVPAPTPEIIAEIGALQRGLGELRKTLAAQLEVLAPLQATWEEAQLASFDSETALGNWTLLEPVSATSKNGQELKSLGDFSILASGTNPKTDVLEVVLEPKPGQTLTALRLEALQHPSMTKGGLARSDSGNFVLTGITLATRTGPAAAAATATATAEPIPVALSDPQASFEQGGYKISGTLDEDPSTGWAVHEGRPVDKAHEGLWKIAEPLSIGEGQQLVVTLKYESKHELHHLGRFRLSVSDDAKPTLVGAGSDLAPVLRVPLEKRSPEQQKLVREAFEDSDPAIKALKARIETQAKQAADVAKSIPKVMVMADMETPRPTYRLDRGLYSAHQEEVPTAVPAMLPQLPAGEKPNRLALAKWLFAEDNPLTARVTVNRIWQQLFGIGLVKTAEDFGVQAEVPPHPELLDWLAADFRETGWDMKRLIRQIVTSRAYRQSSKVSLSLLDVDPENRLLARGARYRMPSWMIRDHALAVSGLLVDKVGGAPVNGYQPPGVWEEASFGKKKYVQGSGDALYRRSLYTFWRRIIGPTLFFDTAGRQVCEVKPKRTNTPLHALTTLNDVTFVEAARVLADRVLTEGAATDDEARLVRIFESILARPPHARERGILLAALARSQAEFEADPEAATQLASFGESKPTPGLDPATHAAWTSLCLAVLNLDEALTRE